jgi:hypothetical protein
MENLAERRLRYLSISIVSVKMPAGSEVKYARNNGAANVIAERYGNNARLVEMN